MFKREKNRLIWQYDRESIWIESWGKAAFRVRVTKNQRMTDENWALTECEETRVQINIGDGGAAVTNGKLTAEIDNAGRVKFRNDKNKILLEEYWRIDTVDDRKRSALKILAREFKAAGGDSYAVTVRFEADRHEKIFGMGQYQQDIWDLKGSVLELAQRNSQASVPFYVSSLGYGFLWNNPAVGEAVFGKNVTEWRARATKQIDYWITAGDTPSEIIERYVGVTGRPPMMPEFAAGFWQSKLRYRTQEELLCTAREYHRRKIPISVIVIDYFHWPNQGTWEFDKDYWPDPQAMAEELKNMGIVPAVSIWPTVDLKCENYDEMLEKGYLVWTDGGIRTQMQLFGDEVFFDATNPEARAYVWGKVRKHYYDKGIKVFWLDVAEPEYSVYDFEMYRYHLGSSLEVGNIYPLMYAKGFYDGMRAEGIENPLNLIRCAWAGSQRYGALVWSGDIYSSFESLRNQVTAGLHMAVAGIYWWTTDIGGFSHGKNEDSRFRELLIRWFQYGTFCPVMRLHGHRLPDKEPLSDKLGGGLCISGADNEVWSFGEKAYEIMLRYIKIREKLKPYITEMMAAAHREGKAPMRPLFYDFPEDDLAWEISDEFMFGSHLLIAPVLYEGAKERKVYLPAGRKWTEVFSRKSYECGWVTILIELENIPVFTDDREMAELFLIGEE